MKNMILIIILIMLACTVNAGIIYTRFVDMTGSGYELIDVYQNDGMSKRYIKTINMSCNDMPTIGTHHNYTLVLRPTRTGVLTDLENPRNISYLYPKLIYYGFIILLISIIFWLYYKGRG